MAKILVGDLEHLVRRGEGQKVQAILKSLQARRIPRSDALAIANLARRTGQFSFALNVLRPIVRPDRYAPEKPSQPEQIEYAAILCKIGAIGEALDLLAAVDSTQHPEALLITAACHYAHWHYSAGVPLLKRYIESAGITPYQRLVGGLNLAAGLVHEEATPEASELLSILLNETRSSEYDLLHGNTLEILAQLEINRGDFAAAERFLLEANTLLVRTGSVGQLWIKKWRTIATSLQTGAVGPDFLKAKAGARQSYHWETVRDLSFYEALIKRDEHKLKKVFFGTPYEPYRRKILQKTSSWFSPESHYFFSSDSQPPQHVLDVSSGRGDNWQQVLPFSHASHRLLIILAGDFFRPASVGAIFSRLFPGEYFSPRSSRARIHQAVLRLRKILAAHHFDLSVQEVRGAYFCQTGAEFGLRVSRQPVPIDPLELQFQYLASQLPDRFTARDVSSLLGSSVSTGSRLLRWALSQRRIQLVGSGPATKYQRIFT